MGLGFMQKLLSMFIKDANIRTACCYSEPSTKSFHIGFDENNAGKLRLKQVLTVPHIIEILNLHIDLVNNFIGDGIFDKFTLEELYCRDRSEFSIHMDELKSKIPFSNHGVQGDCHGSNYHCIFWSSY